MCQTSVEQEYDQVSLEATVAQQEGQSFSDKTRDPEPWHIKGAACPQEIIQSKGINKV